MSSSGRSLLGPYENEFGVFFNLQVSGQTVFDNVELTDKFVIKNQEFLNVLRVDTTTNTTHFINIEADQITLNGTTAGWVRTDDDGVFFTSTSIDFPVIITSTFSVQGPDFEEKFVVKNNDGDNIFKVDSVNKEFYIDGLVNIDGEMYLDGNSTFEVNGNFLVTQNYFESSLPFGLTNTLGLNGTGNDNKFTVFNSTPSPVFNVNTNTNLVSIMNQTSSGTVVINGSNNSSKFEIFDNSSNSIFRVNTTAPEVIIRANTVPSIGDTYSLGASTLRWQNIWGNNINLTGTLKTALTGSSVVQTLSDGTLTASNSGLTLSNPSISSPSISGVTASRIVQTNAFGVFVYSNTLTGVFIASPTISSPTITGYTANRALTSNASGNIVVSATTDTEISFLSGVTSAIQTQINTKLNINNPSYTGTLTTPLIGSRLVQTNASSQLTSSNTLPSGCSAASMSLSGPSISNPSITGTITTALTANAIVQTNASGQLTASLTLPSSVSVANMVLSNPLISVSAPNSLVQTNGSGVFVYNNTLPFGSSATNMSLANPSLTGLTANRLMQTNASGVVIYANTIGSDITATVNKTYNFGSLSLAFNNGFFNTMATNNLEILDDVNNTITIKANLVPDSNNVYDIGSTTNRINQLYCQQIFFGGTTNAITPGITAPNAGTGFAFFVNGSDRMWVAGSGNLQISGGSAWKASGSTWINPSDERLKKDIKPFEEGLEKISKIKPKRFTYRSNDQKAVGIIAQEMLEIYPECITMDESGFYSFDANDIIFILINAVQELNKKLNRVIGRV